MERTGLVSVIFRRGCIFNILLCAVPELLRQRLHKTETVQNLEKKLGKVLEKILYLIAEWHRHKI